MALDWELLCALLDHYDIGYVAKRLSEKYAKQDAHVHRCARTDATPHIRSIRDVHLLTPQLMRELCGAGADAAEAARSAIVKMSPAERLQVVSKEYFPEEHYVRLWSTST